MKLLSNISFITASVTILLAYALFTCGVLDKDGFKLLESMCFVGLYYTCWLRLTGRWISLLAIFMFASALHNFLDELFRINTGVYEFEWYALAITIVVLLLHIKEIMFKWSKN